ncbi:type II secretion system F family protein [Intrasporangium sp.]|uniref:type II secretion system F family protein n=1 Tax=Intrasporangium sp. TaxID=1925024 RepID=UPI00293A02E0|nr:type II secretion system F family protein [Intrasporangium sp.]MDV3222650.1 type II secretion system F family protein [Intrasporangium sp.]
MSPALATPALVTGLLVMVAVLVAPGRQDRPGEEPCDSELESRRGDDPAGSTSASAETSSAALPEAPSPGQVQSALVLLALGYRSGQPTWEVLGAVADVLDAGPEDPPAVSRDLRQVAAALRWGASDTEAWASVDEVWSGAGRAVAIAHRAGIAPGPLLLAAAEDLRRASLEQVELAAARVGVRLVAPLGLVLLPAFCLTTVVPLVVALAGQLLSG